MSCCFVHLVSSRLAVGAQWYKQENLHNWGLIANCCRDGIWIKLRKSVSGSCRACDTAGVTGAAVCVTLGVNFATVRLQSGGAGGKNSVTRYFAIECHAGAGQEPCSFRFVPVGGDECFEYAGAFGVSSVSDSTQPVAPMQRKV